MQQAILKSKVTFLGQTNFLYTLIQIKEKGFFISDIDRKVFKQLNFPKVFTNEYGSIYATEDFKTLLNNNAAQKEKILKILKSLDE